MVRGDTRAVAESSAEVCQLASDTGWPTLAAIGRAFRGWAAADDGEDGAPEMEAGVAALRATNYNNFLPIIIGKLAEVYLNAGHAGRALDAADDALGGVAATGERFFEAEIHRPEAHRWPHWARSIPTRPEPRFGAPSQWPRRRTRQRFCVGRREPGFPERINFKPRSEERRRHDQQRGRPALH